MKKTTVLLLLSLTNGAALAQSIGISTTTPDPSAALDVAAPSKGLLVPRMATSTRTGIQAPAKGLLVYDSTIRSFYFHDGTGWTTVSSPDASALTTGTLSNSRLATTVTVQGNTFNTAGKLVQLGASGELPAVSGANLTSLNAGNLTAGTLAAARMPALTTDVTTAAGSTATTIAANATAGSHIISAVNAATSGTIAPARLGTGTANTTTFLRGDGTYASPTTAPVSFTLVSVGGSSSYTIPSSSALNIIFDFNGASGSGQALTVTLLPASSYPAGTVLYMLSTAYTVAAPSFTIKAVNAMDTYSSFNNNKTVIGTGTGLSIGGGSGTRLMSDGVSRYIRLN